MIGGGGSVQWRMMGEAEERKFVESKNDEKYIAIEFVCKSESCQAIEYLWQAFEDAARCPFNILEDAVGWIYDVWSGNSRYVLRELS